MRKELKILLLTSAFLNFAGGMLGPIYAIFVEEIGGGILVAGAAYSIFSVVTGVMIYVIGKWEDHVKHQEKLLIAGRILAMIGFIGYIFVQNPMQLFVLQALLGLSTAIESPAYDGLYSKFLDRGKYASEWGMWESMYSIVTAVAAITGAYIADAYGFNVLFMGMFLMTLVSTVVAGMLKIK